ncbi:DNA polymerase [Frisingicoccus sp.]|uniref:DNA polymerase n=1 Tax=Frisingicoccus sp. TaxID=1918627 RepID=UPI003AB5D9E4
MEQIRFLSVDIETFSSVDLGKSGVYRYAESEDFEILLFGYSVNGSPVRVVDLACGENLPEEIRKAISDPTVMKWAFNAQFERICLSRFLGMPTGEYLDPVSWHCTMIWSATLGLPMSLAGVGTVLGLEKQKLTEGKDLIRYFCVPCKATKVNGGRTRNLPEHDWTKWERFKSYNLRDVETEMEIQKKLSRFPVPENEWRNYCLDQKINDRGVALDMELAHRAVQCDNQYREFYLRQAREITGLENPNSVLQLRDWLWERGVELDSLSKNAVQDLLPDTDGDVRKVLSLRQELAKSSVKKYTAMENLVCRDSRGRGLIQFYGASRTGRYAGKLLQVQNLPQNHLPDLETARALVQSGNFDALEMLYDSVPNVLSELIRTAIVPKKGCRFIVSDFSAIEARVLSWFAGEQWRLDTFTQGGDIYCASASQMFGVPVEKHGINGELRQKGKQAELACGYGGSVGAMKSMGAVRMGVKEEELQPLVDAWRQANPRIVQFWWEVDRAAKTCVKQHVPTQAGRLRFEYQSGILFIQLPSGRRLAYAKPRMGENRFGGEAITYEGVGTGRKWERLETYGAKCVENIVQGTARDLLALALLRLEQAGYPVVMHCHDEAICEVPIGQGSVKEVNRIMAVSPEWAEGLPLKADGFETEFYKKD